MATTVTGILDDKGVTTLQNTVITFKCTDGASVLGSVVCIPKPDKQVTTDGSGAFSISLAPGNYGVWVGGENYGSIGVPASGSYDWKDLLDIVTTEINELTSQIWKADDDNLVRVTLQFNGAGYQWLFTPIG